MDITTGTEVRGYLLQDSIGIGGFGNVFQALQSSVSREVAIKVILPEYANKPEFIRRFETEAQLIARLEHLHIVPLYDYWRGPDGAYLVMRLMRGGSLEDLITAGPIEIESVALIIDQIAAALDSAHKHGVIHRDIKPSNILLDEDNNAYLSDFGIAKDLEDDHTNLSKPDAVIGTLDYLAPEQAVKEAITPQTDIYSLGVVLYEMLVGEHPFPGVSGVQRVFKHIHEPLPQIMGLDSEITDTINQVVQNATQKNPAKRYNSVLEFADAFRKAAALSSSRMDSQLIELLTPREQEVLSYIIKGKSNLEIAELLTIEFSTVKWYIRQIYKKLNVRSRVQAIVRAREINLIVDDQESAGSPTSSISALPVLKNPFKGLKAFQAIDEQDYFGREELIQTLLKRLSENHKYSRFLAVVGPSGSGKSSLVKAGLIPALWRGQLPKSEKWFIIDMMLGEHPFDELEIALTRIAADQQHNLREQLQRDSRGLVRAANLILPDDQSELVLVLDQFEELFTLVRDEEIRTQFLELLFTAVTDSRSRIRIVVTLRADFYDRPLHYPNFGDLVRSRIETVMPLSAEELERAIVQPAKGVGVEFEEGLVTSIINEAHYQSGALPLMQYALTELFELREDRMLTHDSFHRIGGIVGAIAKSAEEIYKELDPQGKNAVRQMFLRLVNLGEGSEDTKRRVQRSELLSITANPEVMDEIIDTFANYRLVSLDNDPVSRTPVVEVAHEAILHEWERLDAWLDESRDDIRQERQLSNAAAEWKEHDTDTSFLLRGSRLSFFEQWIDETQLALTPLEKDFINESIKERDREIQEETERAAREKRLEVRNRRFLQALVGVLTLAMIVSFWLANSARSAQRTAERESQARATAQVLAEEQGQEALLQADARATAEAIALEQKEQALIQASIGLAALAEQELVGFFPERSVLLALEALENYPYTPQAYSALLHAVNTSRLRLTITPHTALLTSHLRLSQDGTKMITSAQDGTVKISDIRTGEEVLKINPEYDQSRFVRWSPDETKILFVSHYGKAGWSNSNNRIPLIAIYDAVSGKLIRDFPAGEDWF
ncbi:MAG TPA: protein kinase, partial [Anaerolineales bacterium]|nr:protein kinase [Anaerolineales bacterium]